MMHGAHDLEKCRAMSRRAALREPRFWAENTVFIAQSAARIL
jgi:hypothetical protein